MEINYQVLNPNGFHLLKYMQDTSIRFIILFGGSSSSKSYSVAQAVLILTLHDGENTLVYRKVGASITDSIYEDFKTAASQLGISHLFEFKQRKVKCIINGARIDFKGLDKSEKIKGISQYKRVCLEELSEYDREDYKQVRKRLRGKKGQQIISDFNPIKETHWIKKDEIDKDTWHEVPMDVVLGGVQLPPELTRVKSIKMNSAKMLMNPRTGKVEEHAPDTVLIQSTYLNNFWVVGSPDGTYGFYDEQCIADFEKDRINDPDYFNIYALGEWGVIRSGSEFFGSFNRGRHVADFEYDPSLPVHITVDNNVLPYISCEYWQVHTENGMHLRQIDETCAEPPNNTVRKAAALVAERLRELAPERVFLHGDASTRAASTMDDEKRSWLDLFIDTLHKNGVDVIDMVGNKNPSVAMSGEFINAIYEGSVPGTDITVHERCRTSIDDYLSVQKDVNGAILKTRLRNKTTMQTYEEHGHLSDCKRYVVCDILSDQFSAFSNRRKRNLYARDGMIHFYNPDTECTYSHEVVYAMPNVNGKFAMVHGKKCGGKWHIVNAVLSDTTSTEYIKDVLTATGSRDMVIECGKAYYPFVRELRKDMGSVKAMPETNDVDKRIAATSDYVGTNILFNENMAENSTEYSLFMTNLLDYRKDGDAKEASSAISGFIRYVVKSFSDILTN